MAENLSLDELLGASLKRVAEPGDPAGVAEAIRARVDGGDTGTPSTGGEFGAGSGGGWPWMPWLGGAVTAAVVGGLVGASGMFGSLQPGDSASASGDAPSLSVTHVTQGTDCPGGATVVGFSPGDRVLAVARSDDSAFLAVRSPFDRSDTVWLPVSAVEVDAGQSPVASLPVDGCLEPTVTLLPPPEPSQPPAPTTPQQPQQPEPPAPPAPTDNPPSLGTVTISDNTLYLNDEAIITTSATDDHGVSAVQISWSGVDSGSAQMTKVGNQWKYTYTLPVNADGTVTFTVRAVDTKNQKSAPKSVSATTYYFG